MCKLAATPGPISDTLRNTGITHIGQLDSTEPQQMSLGSLSESVHSFEGLLGLEN